MERKIKISSGEVEVFALLCDSVTADKIWDSLPFIEAANIWGDEIYFKIPVNTNIEKDALKVVAKGDLGYWPTGAAFCIFFGSTPISREGEIRPASAVNVFGKIEGDTSVLKKVLSGSEVLVEKADA
jgi:hypothetical protein